MLGRWRARFCSYKRPRKKFLNLAVWCVARTLECSMGAVCKWSKRFDGYGIAGLKDAVGRGRKARLPADKVSLIVERATRPAQGRFRWSVRSMAREAKVS